MTNTLYIQQKKDKTYGNRYIGVFFVVVVVFSLLFGGSHQALKRIHKDLLMRVWPQLGLCLTSFSNLNYPIFLQLHFASRLFTFLFSMYLFFLLTPWLTVVAGQLTLGILLSFSFSQSSLFSVFSRLHFTSYLFSLTANPV